MSTDELCRTLIVDDELLIRQGIKHYIDWEQEGFVIVGEASNGQEALELIEKTNPQIILTDIVMPIMDGEELTRIVKERYPNIEIIILSSFGDFDYVRSTFQNGIVDYILKPQLDAQSLLKVLNTAASRIPQFEKIDKKSKGQLSIEQIITKLISGYEVSLDSQLISQSFPYSYFCLLGVSLKNFPEGSSAEFQTKLEEKIIEAFESSISQGVHYTFNIEQNRMAVLFNVSKNDLPNVIDIASVYAEKEVTIGFALTKEFNELSHLGDVCKRLLKLLDYRFYFPDVPLLMEKNLPESTPENDQFNLDWFTGELKRKHFDSAFSYLKEHVTSLSTSYSTDVFEYKAFFSNIIFNITILLSNMEYEVKELEDAKYTYFKSIDEAGSAHEAVVQLDGFIGQAKRCLASAENHPENLNMKKVMEYIMDHYTEPLTLTEVANHFHFNPSYFSSYFSTHNKEGFIEYLNKIRIEEAAKLLTANSAPISEISGMVGFSDHSYFCKVFKKMRGLSPSQYRRKFNLK